MIVIFFNNDLVVQNIHLHRVKLSVSDRSAAVGIIMSAFQRKKEKRNNTAIIIYTCIHHTPYTTYRCRALMQVRYSGTSFTAKSEGLYCTPYTKQ
jgi:hypothetical protein